MLFRSEWEVISVSGTNEAVLEGGLPLLLCGWDIGDVNHAWVCLQPVYVGNTVCFRVIEEYVVTKAELSVEEFTDEVMLRMSIIRDVAGFPVAWRHYSDSSAFEFKAAIRRTDLPLDSDMTDAAIVEARSKGEIILEGSAQVKKAGWQRRRANFVAQLFRENRLHISANCKDVIQMACNLRKASGSTKAGPYIDPEQKEKHPFDAMSYAISMFALDEILEGGDPETRSQTDRVFSG